MPPGLGISSPRMPRLSVLALLLAAVVAAAAGCGSGSGSASESGSGDKAQASSTPAPAAAGSGCRRVSQPRPKSVDLPKPTLRLAASKTWVATVSTSCGTFEITLDVKDSPRTTGSFASLARKGFYDDTTFHRIVPGFVIQGGDPKGNGTGGPGYTIAEPPPKHVHYDVGTVAMAKTQYAPSGTSGSQFFVMVGASTPLPPEYALLGKVTGGQDAVKRIAAVDADPQSGKPKSPIVIDSIRVAAK